MPTKTSPPCGLAGFKKGFAGVAGVGSNRWGLNVLVDWVIVFFCRFNSSVFSPSKNSAKKNVFSGAGYLRRKQMHKRVAQMEPWGLDERWA